MRGLVAQVKLLLFEHLRMPAYLMASIGFPTIFFLIFAVPEAKTADAANFLLASFLGFAILGVMFLQFAHGLAEERSSAWYQFVRTLPLSGWSFFASRLLVTWILALATAGVVSFCAYLLTPVHLTVARWLGLFLVLIIAGHCFAFMGMALGVWVSERVALPLGNLIYLPLSYAGGLWKPPALLPESVRQLSVYLPTRFYADMLWATAAGEDLRWSSVLHLSAWAAAFLLAAVMGFRYRPLRGI